MSPFDVATSLMFRGAGDGVGALVAGMYVQGTAVPFAYVIVLFSDAMMAIVLALPVSSCACACASKASDRLTDVERHVGAGFVYR